MAKKVCVGLAGIRFDPSFWGFKPEQYKQHAAKLGAVVKKMGYDFVACPETFQDYEQAEKDAKYLKGKGADIVVFDIEAYPEGKAAGVFVSNVDVPLILWSRNETYHNVNVGHNSFCGANFMGGVLTVQGRKYRQIFGEPNDKELKARLDTACKLVGAAKAAAGSKIGLFGEGIVPKFYDIDVNEADRKKLEARWGIKYVGVPTTEFVKQCESYSDADVQKDLKKYTKRFDRIEISDEAVDKQVRMMKAVGDMTRQGGFASVAIRCWPELQQMYGSWPCPVIAVLNDMGLPSACEGDVCGALDMLLVSKLAKTPSTVMDIVDWDDKGDTYSIWHCGPTATSWADKKGATLMGHDVDGSDSQGRPKCGLPGIVDMQFAPAPVTVFRTLGALDDEFVVQGQIVSAPKRNICGSFGAVTKNTIYGEKKSVKEIRRLIFDRLLPHHYTAVHGHVL